MDSKNIALSKTIIGIVIGILAPLAAKHGYGFDPEGLTVDVVTLFGAALAIWGRFTAKTKLAVLPQ